MHMDMRQYTALWSIKYFCSRTIGLHVTHYVTEYPPKLGDIRGYHLGEYSPIFKPTSTTISLHLNFDSRWESVYWLLQKKENICLFIKPYQSTLKRKDTTQQIENCSKQFFHMHCRIMIWRIKTQWPFFFARKHVRIFVLGFLEASSSPRVSLSENCLHPSSIFSRQIGATVYVRLLSLWRSFRAPIELEPANVRCEQFSNFSAPVQRNSISAFRHLREKMKFHWQTRVRNIRKMSIMSQYSSKICSDLFP